MSQLPRLPRRHAGDDPLLRAGPALREDHQIPCHTGTAFGLYSVCSVYRTYDVCNRECKGSDTEKISVSIQTSSKWPSAYLVFMINFPQHIFIWGDSLTPLSVKSVQNQA